MMCKPKWQDLCKGITSQGKGRHSRVLIDNCQTAAKLYTNKMRHSIYVVDVLKTLNYHVRKRFSLQQKLCVVVSVEDSPGSPQTYNRTMTCHVIHD